MANFFDLVKKAFGFTADGEDLDRELDLEASAPAYPNPFGQQSPSQERSATPTTSHHHSDPASGTTNEQITALQNQIGQLTTLVKNLSAQKQLPEAKAEKPAPVAATEADTNLDEIKQRLQVSEAQRRAAKNRANDLALKIEELQLKVDTLEVDKKALQNKLKVVQVQTGQVPDDTITILSPEELDAQQAAMEQLRQQVQQGEQQNALLLQQAEEAQAELRAAQEIGQQLQEAQDLIKRKNQETAALQAQIEELQKQETVVDEQLRAQLILAGEESAKLRKEVEQLELNAKNNAKKQQRRDIETGNHIDELKRQLASAAQIIDRQQSETVAAQTSMQQLSDQVSNLTAERDQLAEQVQRLRGELQETRLLLEASKIEKPQEGPKESQKIEAEQPATPEQTAASVATERKPQDTEPQAVQEPEPPQSSFAPSLMQLEEDDDPQNPRIDDIDDIDWLIPVEPDIAPANEPEDEEPFLQPIVEPKAVDDDPRQLSLF